MNFYSIHIRIMNRLFLLLMAAVLTLSLAACGDDKDEPSGGTPAEGIYYPTLPAGHKCISHLEKTFSNGLVASLDAQYDAEGHLLEAKMTMPYGDGTNTESIKMYYSKGIISHTLGWQTTEYTFTTNANGAITSVVNNQGKNVARFSYDYNQLQTLSTVGSATTYSNVFLWKNSDRLHGIVTATASKKDSVVLSYTSYIPNVASINFMGIGQSPFGDMIEVAMRSAGLFGQVSADLPRSVLWGNSSYLDETGKMIPLHCIIDYATNSDGSVESLVFTVPRTTTGEKISNLESYSMKFTYK